MKNNAAILITVYDRLDHLKRCVNSLLKCEESFESTVYISSDFQKDDSKKKDVDQIRDYIDSIKGFKKVVKLYHSKNLGSDLSIKVSIDKIFIESDKFILLEDDVEVSPLFLKYINESLNYYNNTPNIFSICGFSAFIMSDNYDNNTPNKIFLNHSWAAWGVASWKHKFLEFAEFRNSEELLNIVKQDLKDNQFVKSLNILSPKYYIHLLHCVKSKKLPEFDYLAAYYCLKKNMFNIYSNHTLTKNYGHDGTGLRSLKNELINIKMVRAKYLEVLPEFKPINELDILSSLPVKSENIFQAFFKILLIRLGLFDFAKTAHRYIINLNSTN